MMSKKLYDKYKEKIRLVGEKENHPFEKPLHETVCASYKFKL